MANFVYLKCASGEVAVNKHEIAVIEPVRVIDNVSVETLLTLNSGAHVMIEEPYETVCNKVIVFE